MAALYTDRKMSVGTSCWCNTLIALAVASHVLFIAFLMVFEGPLVLATFLIDSQITNGVS